MSELVYRKPCEHGDLVSHFTCDGVSYPEYDQMEHSEELCVCPGGVEQVLDPEQILGYDSAVDVAEVLEILDGEGV